MKLLLVLIALFMPLAAAAQTSAFTPFTEGMPVTLRPDRAYILYRTSTAQSPFAIEPSFLLEPDVPMAGPNVFPSDYDRPFFRNGRERVFLLEAVPGRYTLLGISWEGATMIATCFCFGTVSFPAKAGAITDMGYIFVDKLGAVSKVPELAAVTGGRAKLSSSEPFLTGAIRPYAEGMPLPAALAALPRAAAAYRPVGKFPNGFAYSIDRLAPIPGVLAYDEDRVIGADAP